MAERKTNWLMAGIQASGWGQAKLLGDSEMVVSKLFGLHQEENSKYASKCPEKTHKKYAFLQQLFDGQVECPATFCFLKPCQTG